MLENYQIQENEQVLHFLKKALNNVSVDYIIQNYDAIATGIQKPERIFVAELYHQLRILQEQNSDIDFFNNLSFHQEPNKQGSFIIPNSKCLPKKPIKRISPDLVLHKGQNNSSAENQLLICEVKMAGATAASVDKDLRKLIFYKVSRLRFQHSIFIYTGDLSGIENFLSSCLPIENYRNTNSLVKCLKRNKVLFALPYNKNNDYYEWEIFSVRTNF